VQIDASNKAPCYLRVALRSIYKTAYRI